MTLHEEWTDKLSDFLDDELTPDERYAVESHLHGCADCARVLEDLKAVAARARALDSRPPDGDLWPAVAARIEAGRPGRVVPMPLLSELARRRAQGEREEAPAPRRFSFTMPQLAAASLLIATVSGAAAWRVSRQSPAVRPQSTVAGQQSTDDGRSPTDDRLLTDDRRLPTDDGRLSTVDFHVSLADAQYDAAVTDLEKALKNGRNRLDPQTITIVEHNLQTIDEAIRQAREALAADPANTYLSGHLIEARRRKLDLLRRAAELSESD